MKKKKNVPNDSRNPKHSQGSAFVLLLLSSGLSSMQMCDFFLESSLSVISLSWQLQSVVFYSALSLALIWKKSDAFQCLLECKQSQWQKNVGTAWTFSAYCIYVSIYMHVYIYDAVLCFLLEAPTDECRLSRNICGHGECENSLTGHICHCHPGYHFNPQRNICEGKRQW